MSSLAARVSERANEAAARKHAYHEARRRARHAEVMREHAHHVIRDTPTHQEARVLELLAAGHSYSSAGSELCISHETARTYARKAMRKLGARNRTHAVAIALRQGWIQ